MFIVLDPSQFIAVANGRGELALKIFVKFGLIAIRCSNVLIIGFNLIYCLIRFGRLDVNHLYFAHRLL